MAEHTVVRIAFSNGASAREFVEQAVVAMLTSRAVDDYSLSISYDARERYRKFVAREQAAAARALRGVLSISTEAPTEETK